MDKYRYSQSFKCQFTHEAESGSCVSKRIDVIYYYIAGNEVDDKWARWKTFGHNVIQPDITISGISPF